MAVSSVTLTLPTITGTTVTERERQLEEYVNILLKELEYYMNEYTKAINALEAQSVANGEGEAADNSEENDG